MEKTFLGVFFELLGLKKGFAIFYIERIKRKIKEMIEKNEKKKEEKNKLKKSEK